MLPHLQPALAVEVRARIWSTSDKEKEEWGLTYNICSQSLVDFSQSGLSDLQRRLGCHWTPEPLELTATFVGIADLLSSNDA